MESYVALSGLPLTGVAIAILDTEHSLDKQRGVKDIIFFMTRSMDFPFSLTITAVTLAILVPKSDIEK